MKNIAYKILLSILLVGGTSFITSCNDVLDTPAQSSMDESVIFSTPILAEASVMGIHQSFGETNSYRGRFLPFYGINTDIEWYNSSEKTSDDRALLTGYKVSPTNSKMNTDNNAWAKFYEGIERANLCIRGLRTYGKTETNPVMAQLLGEALTLRAVIYTDLVKAWGDVPARFEPITSETLYLAKSDRDVIYKHLLSDLEEAEGLVAWPNGSSVTKSTERVSKAFVKGLRARIALYAAGYSQRPDGTIRRSTDPELSVEKMYTIAKKECLDIIDSKTLTLGSFEDNFKALCQDDVTAGKESIWEIPFSDGRGRVLYTLGVKHTTFDQYTQQSQGGTNGPIPTLYYDFNKDDVRRDITCVPYEWKGDGINYGTSESPLYKNGIQIPRKVNSWCFGKLRYEWMNRVVTSSNDDGINWQYMRYADIYLMAAEALNELESPSVAAPYLKKILDRALPANEVTEYMAKATTSKEAFFNAIVEQRGFEFCGEMLRKADLIRWNLLGTKMAEAKEKMTDLANRQGAYADLPRKIYYKTAEDGESLIIYGLNHGDTDAEGKALDYESNTDWLRTAQEAEEDNVGKADKDKVTASLTTQKIESLYQQNPDENEFWPIWQTFIDKSNGMLKNDYNY